MGVDPNPLTLRELNWMVHGRFNEAWDRHSHLLAMLANAHRDIKKRKRPYRPEEFHPVHLAKKRGAMTIDEAKELFAGFKRRRPKEHTNG